MIDRLESFRYAAKKALKIRVEKGFPLTRPCDVYQLITAADLELQFISVPTLEGMYLEDGRTKRICVSSFRPAGRQRFTAAHELGHSTLLHGTKVDAIDDVREAKNDFDEELADTFAAALMLPNSAVHAGFRLRNIDPARPSPAQTYRIATWLGVGYKTLADHLLYSMKLMSRLHHKQLLRHEPKGIKSELAKQQTTREVLVFDRLWDGERAHVQIGDLLMGVTQAENDSIVAPLREGLSTANSPGQTKVAFSGGTAKVSVCRENYIGFYEFRYLPEEE